ARAVSWFSRFDRFAPRRERGPRRKFDRRWRRIRRSRAVYLADPGSDGARSTDDQSSGATAGEGRAMQARTDTGIGFGHALVRGVTGRMQGWRRLVARPYRPEKHYMRGPGPKWRAKNAAEARLRALASSPRAPHALQDAAR